MHDPLPQPVYLQQTFYVSNYTSTFFLFLLPCRPVAPGDNSSPQKMRLFRCNHICQQPLTNHTAFANKLFLPFDLRAVHVLVQVDLTSHCTWTIAKLTLLDMNPHTLLAYEHKKNRCRDSTSILFVSGLPCWDDSTVESSQQGKPDTTHIYSDHFSLPPVLIVL